MAESAHQYANFREAFCAVYRCTPATYGRTVLLRSIPPIRRLFAYPIVWFNRSFFAVDLDIINNLGESRSPEMFSNLLDELHGVNVVERSIRRGFLGIRPSGARLMALWDSVQTYVRPMDAFERAKVQAEPTTLAAPQIAVERRVSEAVAPSRDTSPLTTRRVRKAFDDILNGVSVPDACRASGFEQEEFLRLLELNGASQPPFRWLREQLLRDRRLAELEAENARLRHAVADRVASGPR